jgi:hypothetical protein
MTTPKIERRGSTVHLIPESIAPLRCGDIVLSRRVRRRVEAAEVGTWDGVQVS